MWRENWWKIWKPERFIDKQHVSSDKFCHFRLHEKKYALGCCFSYEHTSKVEHLMRIFLFFSLSPEHTVTSRSLRRLRIRSFHLDHQHDRGSLTLHYRDVEGV